MSVEKGRVQKWLVLIGVAAGLLPAAILGLWWFMGATATLLHPDPRDVPSVTQSAPLPAWTQAVEQGRQLVRAALVEQNLPGLSVAVGAGGDIVWAEGFGWADLENRMAVAPKTRFRIGTASTALTSAGAGLLLEQGRLALDEKIQMYVPEFPEKQWPVTLRHVMEHTAGVRNDSGDEGPLLSQRCERPVDGLPSFAKGALLFEPGTRFRYSSYGWILVSAAVEAAAGEPFHTFMRRQVFDPLGMDDTRAESTEPIPNRATSYFPRFASDPRYGLHLTRPIDFSCYAGSSAFLSTPSDLVRFAMAIDGGRLLQPSTVQLLQTSQQTRLAGHDGEVLGGMVASFMRFPEHGLVVSVTSNISYADTHSLAVKIAQAFADRSRPVEHGAHRAGQRRR